MKFIDKLLQRGKENLGADQLNKKKVKDEELLIVSSWKLP